MAVYRTRYAPYVDLVVTATYGSANVNNNETPVTVKVELQVTSTSGANPYNDYNQTVTARIDGAVAGTASYTYNIAPRGSKTLGTWTKNVKHRSDGTKSVAINVTAGGGGDSGSINETMSLPTIARASQPTLNKASVALGSPVEIHFNRATTSFTHTVKYIFGAQTVAIASKTTEGMVTYTPNASLASEIPNDTSGWGSIEVETFNGKTSLGKKTVRLTVTIPDTAAFRPTAEKPALVEKNSTVKNAVTGYWLEGLSIVGLSTTFTMAYNAKPRIAYFTVGNTDHSVVVSGSSASVDIPLDAGALGAKSVTFTVIDTRGRKVTSAANSFTITAYTRPTLTVSAYRSEEDDNKIIIEAKGTTTALGTQNTLSMKAYIRPSGATTWPAAIKTTNSTNGLVEWTPSTWAGDVNNYPETESFQVRVTLQDELSSESEAIETVGTIAFPFSAYRDEGVGIGKIYEPSIGGSLQIAGLTTINGSIHLTGNDQDIRFTIDPIVGNASLELGSTKEVSTPYIDFHSSGTTNDRDARIIATGGTGGQVESGRLDYRAAIHNFTGPVYENGRRLVDYGNNENGHWVKLADGTLICWGRDLRNIAVSTANGNIFRSNQINYTYPAAFVGPYPQISISAFDSMTALMEIESRTAFGVMLFKGTSNSNLRTQITWQAIGRWK